MPILRQEFEKAGVLVSDTEVRLAVVIELLKSDLMLDLTIRLLSNFVRNVIHRIVC